MKSTLSVLPKPKIKKVAEGNLVTKLLEANEINAFGAT